MVKIIWALLLGAVVFAGYFFLIRDNKDPTPLPIIPSEQNVTPDSEEPDTLRNTKDTKTKTPPQITTKKPTIPATNTEPTNSVLPVYPTPTISTTSVCNTALINSDGYDSMRVISKEACDLVNNLYKEGKAAGNIDDTYENRDGLHVNFCDGWSPSPECPIANRPFPQHKWLFSGGAGRATAVRPGVTIGQASYGGGKEGGVHHSIAYSSYKTQSGADILYNQYTQNNLYIYPSLDESKIDNIANTPYVISSEYFGKYSGTYFANAASGSDLPFVKIIMLGLASLKPEVKTSLKNSSFLMPTLQMLIRHAHRSVNSEVEYLSSVAHDNVYRAHYLSGGLPQPNYNSAKLVRMANELNVADIPPLVRLKVVSENFTSEERLFDTPGAMARSVAAGIPVRTITISAADSIDINGSKSDLIYEWRILKGDTSKVKITQNGSAATIEFTQGNVTERLDVGVFVKKQNGKYYSVPGIISMYVRS